jgi:hypothetical protein
MLEKWGFGTIGEGDKREGGEWKRLDLEFMRYKMKKKRNEKKNTKSKK